MKYRVYANYLSKKLIDNVEANTAEDAICFARPFISDYSYICSECVQEFIDGYPMLDKFTAVKVADKRFNVYATYITTRIVDVVDADSPEEAIELVRPCTPEHAGLCPKCQATFIDGDPILDSKLVAEEV